MSDDVLVEILLGHINSPSDPEEKPGLHSELKVNENLANESHESRKIVLCSKYVKPPELEGWVIIG